MIHTTGSKKVSFTSRNIQTNRRQRNFNNVGRCGVLPKFLGPKKRCEIFHSASPLSPCRRNNNCCNWQVCPVYPSPLAALRNGGPDTCLRPPTQVNDGSSWCLLANTNHTYFSKNQVSSPSHGTFRSHYSSLCCESSPSTKRL